MHIWHLRFSSDGRHPLFSTESARRSAVLVLVRHAGPCLVAFGIVDDHVHVVVVCSRARAGRLSRAILLGLRPVAGLGFEPSFIKPVESRAHLKRLVTYCIEQPAKHGLRVHPALWSGSCFADLVGSRVIDGLELRVREVLPRFRERDAWAAVGWESRGVAPMDDDQVRGVGMRALLDAAAFATCGAPDLRGRTKRETVARAAVVSMARGAGYRREDIGRALEVTREAVRQLGHRGIDERVVRAVGLRLAIDEVAARGRKG
jgi:hypothetical protein